MIDEISLEMKLLKGSPIPFADIGYLKSAKLSKIIDEIGFITYNEYINILCLSQDNLEDYYNITGISVFDFLIINAYKGEETFKNKILKALQFAFDEPVYVSEYGFFYLGDINEGRFLNKDNYKEFITLISKINNIEYEEDEFEQLEANAGNERAREMIKQLRKNRKELKKHVKKSNMTLMSIISGIAWKNSSINIFNIWDLTIYQLYDAYYRICIVDNYENTMTGIYAGNISAKDGSIDFKKIHWAKKIEKEK